VISKIYSSIIHLRVGVALPLGESLSALVFVGKDKGRFGSSFLCRNDRCLEGFFVMDLTILG